MKLTNRIVSLCLACTVALASISSVARASLSTPEPRGDDAQATEALRQGRALLKRGHADQALPLLENALKLYTAADAPRGAAAAHDALGDLYTRQGQYARALDHFKQAQQNFAEAESKGNAMAKAAGFTDNSFNTDLMLAKIGETYFRMGDVQQSGAAYAGMRVTKPNTGAVAIR